MSSGYEFNPYTTDTVDELICDFISGERLKEIIHEVKDEHRLEKDTLNDLKRRYGYKAVAYSYSTVFNILATTAATIFVRSLANYKISNVDTAAVCVGIIATLYTTMVALKNIDKRADCNERLLDIRSQESNKYYRIAKSEASENFKLRVRQIIRKRYNASNTLRKIHFAAECGKIK